MKLFFAYSEHSLLADPYAALLDNVKAYFLYRPEFSEVSHPEHADYIIINETFSFKEWRYIDKMLGDPILGKYAHKTYTINTDDCATGLIRGLYTSMPKQRYLPTFHKAVPYCTFPNELILDPLPEHPAPPTHLAAWRGNTKSHKIRPQIIALGKRDKRVLAESTASWYNHQEDEKRQYIDTLRKGKFTLCPRGLSPVSYRIFESMALGICPVILSDEYIYPDGPEWEKFALILPESKINEVANILEKEEYRYQELGACARKNWEEFMHPEKVFEYYVDSLVELFNRKPKKNSIELEIARWRSRHTYVTNGWTIKKPIQNKVRKLTSA